MILYGIPNCDTVKKARKWLQARGIDCTFHDYKKLGVLEDVLRKAIERFGYDKVLNRSGTTWRKLDELRREKVVDDESALELMQENSSIIKRPLLVDGDTMLLGFKEAEYEKLSS